LQSDSACEGCKRAPTEDPLAGWLTHLLLLQDMIECGCRFGPDDLTWDEWMGLGELRAAQNRIWQEAHASN